MSRLPIPGADDGTWGDILNDYLDQSHSADGTLKASTVSNGVVVDGAINLPKLETTIQNTLTKASTSVQSVNAKVADGSGAISLTVTDIGAIANSQIGVANGVASLDANSKLPAVQVPDLSGSYVSQQALPLKLNAISRQDRRERRLGPVTTDITSLVTTTTPDGTITRNWPVVVNNAATDAYCDFGQGGQWTITGSYWAYPNLPKSFQQHSIRFMSDAPKLAIALWNSLTYCAYQVFVDNAPVSLTPTALPSGTCFLVASFPSSATRLIEVRTQAAFGPIYTGSTYTVWRPRPLQKPRVLIVGDSYVSPIVWTSAGALANYSTGIYQGIEDYLNIEDLWIDGVGGTGYLQRTGGLNNNYNDRLSDHVAIDPDILVVHGGGANDMVNGTRNVSSTQVGVVAYFQGARAALPNAKLVFIEGFGPANSPYAALNTSYAQLSANLQTTLTATGVYYVDVATTSPWLTGTGYTPGHTTGDGNSDRYVGSDGVHLTIEGAAFVKARMAPKLQAILTGQASVNTLI